MSQDDVAKLFQQLTSGALGVNPPDYKRVRVDWQEEGQPFQNYADNVAYVAAALWNTEYAKIRDLERADVTGPPVAVAENWTYTRGWRIGWVFYGPTAADDARKIWSAFVFMNYFSDALESNGISVVTDPDEPTWIPENINGQWFKRADFHVYVYEKVTESINDGKTTSVEVKVYQTDNPSGPVADFTVQ
jgi:hypothetical protein